MSGDDQQDADRRENAAWLNGKGGVGEFRGTTVGRCGTAFGRDECEPGTSLENPPPILAVRIAQAGIFGEEPGVPAGSERE